MAMYRNFLNIDDRAAMEREELDARLAPQRERETAQIAAVAQQHPEQQHPEQQHAEALRQRGGDATAPEA